MCIWLGMYTLNWVYYGENQVDILKGFLRLLNLYIQIVTYLKIDG